MGFLSISLSNTRKWSEKVRIMLFLLLIQCKRKSNSKDIQIIDYVCNRILKWKDIYYSRYCIEEKLTANFNWRYIYCLWMLYWSGMSDITKQFKHFQPENFCHHLCSVRCTPPNFLYTIWNFLGVLLRYDYEISLAYYYAIEISLAYFYAMKYLWRTFTL